MYAKKDNSVRLCYLNLFYFYIDGFGLLSYVRVTRYLVFCVMFYRLLFVFLSFFVWPLCCLSFFDLRPLLTPLASWNSSYESVVFLQAPAISYNNIDLIHNIAFTKCDFIYNNHLLSESCTICLFIFVV